MTGFPPHFRLMLLAARPAHTDAELEALRVAASPEQPVDWREFLAVSMSHKVGSLVWRSLRQAGATGIPAPAAAAFTTHSRTNAARAVRVTLETQRLLTLFADAGLPLTMLKGVALSQTVYGDPATRHVGDLDLLIQPREFEGQIVLLQGAGYRITNPACDLSPRRLAIYAHCWKDITFRHESSGLEVDLHWRLFNNRGHPGNCLADSGRSAVAAFGTQVPALAPVDQALYSAVHGVSDSWIYLKGLADVAAFLRGADAAELDEAMRRAQNLGLLRQVGSAFHLAGEWFGAPVEHRLLSRRDDPFHGRLRSRTLAALRAEKFRPRRRFPGVLRSAALELELVPGVRSAAEIVERYVWRPRIWSLVPLPESLVWCYPLLGALVPPASQRAD